MNSLVVLFSVMALAAASPSGLWYEPGVIGYSAPALAVAPSAVSHQSRVDIKSSPAVVSETITPLARTVVAEPAAVVAEQAAVVPAPAAYAAPLTYSAHAALAAPVAIAPSAVSSQSRIDIKSSPAVVSTVASAPIVSGLAAAPIAYGAQISSLYAPSAVAAVAPTIFRSAAIGPVAVSAPATAVLPVGPAETPEVVAARAAHLEAKARVEAETHSIRKRSAQFVAAPVISSYSTPILSTYASSPLVYSSPVAHVSSYGVPAPYITRVL